MMFPPSYEWFKTPRDEPPSLPPKHGSQLQDFLQQVLPKPFMAEFLGLVKYFLIYPDLCS
jgi:hypothetical protein